MTCPRCDGLVLQEYLINPREGVPVGLLAFNAVLEETGTGSDHDIFYRPTRTSA
jgi:hypothetical protein